MQLSNIHNYIHWLIGSTFFDVVSKFDGVVGGAVGGGGELGVAACSSGTIRARFSYADDIGVLGIGPTMVDSAAAAQREVDSLLDWAHRNAVKFDHEKSEVVQFQGRSQKGFANINIDATEIAPTEHIRWLGVYHDS